MKYFGFWVLDFGLRLRRFGAASLSVAAVLVAAGCATAGAGRGASPIDAAVDAASKRCGCRIGVAARHLESGLTYERNQAQEFESASVIKIAILTEAMAQVRAGKISLSDRWTLTEEKKADGSVSKF